MAPLSLTLLTDRQFINHLLEYIGDKRKRVKVGDQLASCTFDLQSVVIDNQIQCRGVAFMNLNDDNRIVIVDTPGFDDKNASDFEILKRIAKWLEESYVPRIPLKERRLTTFSGSSGR